MKVRSLTLASSLMLCLSTYSSASAADQPKTPEEFAAQYMAAFNHKDKATLQKLRYPSKSKSPMQELVDEMMEAGLTEGTQYNKFEINPVPPEMDKPVMGIDGSFYKPSFQPSHVVKLISETANGSSSTSMPIGKKNGVYWQIGLEIAAGETPAYNFGWQRFSAPKSGWSVLMPNEPEPGRAALEKQSGKDALNDPDVYGVVKNTASIKTTQHWFRCGAEGKRVNDKDNKEIFTASCTNYDPNTLKEWFSDPKKYLADAVDLEVRRDEGKLVNQKDIELAGAPGKEFEIQSKDGTLKLGRVYWIKDALYELSFESKKDKPDLTDANKFLGSLKVQ